LGCNVPIFCPAFLTDIAFTIQENEEAFIESYGCAFPPCRGFCPSEHDSDRYKTKVKEIKKLKDLTDADHSVLVSCLDIACCSVTSWACHKSNLKQASLSRAIGFLALHYEQDEIYKVYLGQDIVWEVYLKMVTILEQISQKWVPWHGVTEENGVSSGHQVVMGVRNGDHLDPIIGVAIAQSAADVDMKYRKGMTSIWKNI
ncbi:hypothetical protein BYT27DRAFT_7072950, partial [Phlegmacium glaucopus]